MKTILMIGAGFLQSFVIKRAKALGYHTLCIDGNPHAPGFADADDSACIDIVNTDACLAYARRSSIDGVLTAATDYGVLTASRIAETLGLPGLPYTAAVTVKNKYAVRRALSNAGADDTGAVYDIHAQTDLACLAKQLLYPLMVKPCDGSGSRGASKVSNPADFPAACSHALQQSRTGHALAEPFVVGQEYGVEAFVLAGDIHILAVMQKKMTKPPYYAELGHTYPSGLAPELEQRIVFSATKAIQALGITFGSVNMDVLLTDDHTVHIVDIGARMGGNLIGSHIVPIGTGIDYMGNLLRATVGDPTDFAPSRQPGAVTTRLLALDEGYVEELPDFAKIEREWRVSILHHLAVGDSIHTYHTNLDGCGYVLASGGTAAENTRRAEAALQAVNCSVRRKN